MTVNTRALWRCATERNIDRPIHVSAAEWLALDHCIWKAVGLITGLETIMGTFRGIYQHRTLSRDQLDQLREPEGGKSQ